MAKIKKIKIGNTQYDIQDTISGYTSNVGTVTSVNNTLPDSNGNVSLTIPTVNNPTITITQGGTTKGSFTLNQSSGDTIALDAGGGSGGASALSDLSDVTISSASNGQLLKYNGSKWANSTVSIPTVYNGTLTITQGGVSKGTFTANASSDKTIALDAGAYTAGTGITLSGGAISVQQEDLGTGDRYIWDVTEVGALTKNDGIYSGFSSSNYLIFPHIPSSINSIEISFTFKTTSDVNTWQVIMGQSSTNRATPQVEIEDGYAKVLFSSTGSSWDGGLRATVSINKTYVITGIWNGSTISGTLKDVATGTTTALTVYSGSSSMSSVNWLINSSIGMDEGNNNARYRGFIDLHKSYIKVNGELFYMHQTSIAKATNSLYGLVKPDNSTITVLDGVISATSEIPSQTGNSGKVLTTDGTNASWGTTTQIYPIIESYVNGADWYNVYSNGFCEQGGTIASGLGASGSVTFLKPYANTNGFGIEQCSQYTNYGGYFCLTASSETGFSWSKVNTNVITYWKAQGYVNLQS